MIPSDAQEKFRELLDIVARLRAPDGCPWDREQTLETIAPYLVEEAHEAAEAIHTGDTAHLCEELGDMMLEVTLLAQIAQESGQFTVSDALQSINEKLVRRHPHVFGDPNSKGADNSEAIQVEWSRIKAKEKPGRTTLDGVPPSLPALHRARRISEKAGSVGFDWPDADSVLDKVEEECAELREALAEGNKSAAAEELGDLLFALVNLGRHLELDAETCLNGTTRKFIARFARVEEGLKQKGVHPADATLDEMEALWQAAKKEAGQ